MEIYISALDVSASTQNYQNHLMTVVQHEECQSYVARGVQQSFVNAYVGHLHFKYQIKLFCW